MSRHEGCPLSNFFGSFGVVRPLPVSFFRFVQTQILIRFSLNRHSLSLCPFLPQYKHSAGGFPCQFLALPRLPLFPEGPELWHHPECSLGAVRPRRTRNSFARRLFLGRKVSLLNRVLCHLLHRHSSSIHAREGTGTSCTTNMHSYFSRASRSEAG